MRIGFQLPDAEDVEPEVGAAIPDESEESPWHEGLFDFLLEHWIRFATVYGTFAAIRDLIRCI